MSRPPRRTLRDQSEANDKAPLSGAIRIGVGQAIPGEPTSQREREGGQHERAVRLEAAPQQ